MNRAPAYQVYTSDMIADTTGLTLAALPGCSLAEVENNERIRRGAA